MVQSKVASMSDVKINVQESLYPAHDAAGLTIGTMATTPTALTRAEPHQQHQHQHQHQQQQQQQQQPCWHIPRPSLLGRLERSTANPDSSNNSEIGTWKHATNGHHHHHHVNSPPSRGSSSSQGSTASTHSAASGTLLLTAANLANLAAMHPPRITAPGPKELDELSVASSTHFTVVNGLGRPSNACRKSWCARNQLTVLVCTMSFLFMLGLLAGVLYMDVRAKSKYH